MTERHHLLLAQAEELLAERRPVEAIECFTEAERTGSDAERCSAGRWNCFMLSGDYGSAWKESDAIRARGSYDSHRVWDGTPIKGKRLMIRSVHGFGDAVQMIRYMPLLKAQRAGVTVQVAPRLAGLARTCPGIDEVVVWGEERPVDSQCEITELPYIFRSTLATLPAKVPYLRVPSAVLEVTKASLETTDRMKVGLVWSASDWDSSRSIPLTLLSPLLDLKAHIDFWSLQAAEANTAWEAFCIEKRLVSRSIGGGSLLGLAAAILNMDLIITVDTLAAHLAGALGVEVWTLLKKDADWRWMLDREDSPWYPTMRLFRQRLSGDWQTVISDAVSALRVRIGMHDATLESQRLAL